MAKRKVAVAEKEQRGRAIVIPGTRMEGIILSLEGTAPLIVHKFSEKAKGEIRNKRAKKATKTEKAQKGAPEIAADMMACHHAVKGNERLGPTAGRFGFPASGFKNSCVRAATLGSGMKMTEARIMFFVTGEVVPLTCERIELHEDAMKVQNKADLRYRPYYYGWGAEVGVRYNPDVISSEQIVNLFDIAGSQVGIGENRPGKTGGTFGTWKVVNVRNVSIDKLPDYRSVFEDNELLAEARGIARKMGAL